MLLNDFTGPESTKAGKLDGRAGVSIEPDIARANLDEARGIGGGVVPTWSVGASYGLGGGYDLSGSLWSTLFPFTVLTEFRSVDGGIKLALRRGLTLGADTASNPLLLNLSLAGFLYGGLLMPAERGPYDPIGYGASGHAEGALLGAQIGTHAAYGGIRLGLIHTSLIYREYVAEADDYQPYGTSRSATALLLSPSFGVITTKGYRIEISGAVVRELQREGVRGMAAVGIGF